jgi:hypothetical protein
VDGQVLWLPSGISPEQLKNLAYNAKIDGAELANKTDVFELQSASVTDDNNNVYKVLSSFGSDEQIQDPNFASNADQKLSVSRCSINIASSASAFEQPLSKVADFIYRSIIPRVRTFTVDGPKLRVLLDDTPTRISDLRVNPAHVAGTDGFLSVLFTGEGIDEFVEGRLRMLDCKKKDAVPGRLTELLQKTAVFDMDLDMSPGEQILFGRRQHELLFYRFMAWYTCEMHANKEIVLPYVQVMKQKVLANTVQSIVVLSREIAYRTSEIKTVDEIYDLKIDVKDMEYRKLFSRQ